jgi:hypothetical protein
MLMLFDQDSRGHRLGYLTFVASTFEKMNPEVLFGKSPITWLRLVGADHAFLSSADHYTVFAVSVGICRKLLGKQTSALFIAAERLGYHSSIISGLKRWLLCFSKTTGCLHAATITPLDLSPALTDLCQSWIYDLQFLAPNLGINHAPTIPERPFIEQCRAKTLKGSSLVLLLGNLGVTRGLGDFIRTASENPTNETHLTFVAAGNADLQAQKLLSVSCGPEMLAFPQGLGSAGFDELFNLADLIWCYFSPDYDQNSGIFCNAVRNAKPVLIRKNSLLYHLGIDHVKMNSIGWPGKPFPEDSVILSPSDYSRNFPVKCSQQTNEVLSSLILTSC